MNATVLKQTVQRLQNVLIKNVATLANVQRDSTLEKTIIRVSVSLSLPINDSSMKLHAYALTTLTFISLAVMLATST